MFIFLDNQTGFLLIVKYVKNSKIIFCYCKIVATPENKYEYSKHLLFTPPATHYEARLHTLSKVYEGITRKVFGHVFIG